MKLYKWLGTALGSLTLSLLSNTLSATSGLAAEQLVFSYPPFGDFEISTTDLEVFAKEGKITDNFAYYAKRVNSKQREQLRELLQNRFAVTPTLVSQFFYTPLGESVLKRLGEIFETDSRMNGFYALRSAFILAAADPEGLTAINVLRRYPTRSIRLNLGLTQGLVGELSGLLKKRDAIVATIGQQSLAEATQSTVNFSQQPDLRLPGSFRVQKQSLTLVDTQRNRQLPYVLYLPQVQNPAKKSIPVIVISHGVAEDSNSYAYLAKHLATYGFAVAAIEHPGTNAKKFQDFFAGLGAPPNPNEFVNRPLDIKYLLDELERRAQSEPNLAQLNLQKVGLIGHSLGGSTVLTLAGAKINLVKLRRDCRQNRTLNVSVLLQCRAADLPNQTYNFLDTRVKAVIAINPLTSEIFGESELSQIQLPLMFIGSSQDIVTPTVPEQIRPFTWLKTKDKYLALIENGTHFSTVADVEGGGGVLPVPAGFIGPNPALARTCVDALSVAFAEAYLANKSEYRSYLNPAYAKFISQAPLNLSLLQSFTPKQLQEAADRKLTKQ